MQMLLMMKMEIVTRILKKMIVMDLMVGHKNDADGDDGGDDGVNVDLSIYLHILPYALADILGSCMLSSNVSRKRKRIKA